MEAVPAVFPCERSLRVGEFAILAGDVIYCLDCYRQAEAVLPALAQTSERFQLRRGVTCGGGHAED